MIGESVAIKVTSDGGHQEYLDVPLPSSGGNAVEGILRSASHPLTQSEPASTLLSSGPSLSTSATFGLTDFASSASEGLLTVTHSKDGELSAGVTALHLI